MLFKAQKRPFHWNKNKEQINVEFSSILQDPGLLQPCLNNRGYSKFLANKSQNKEVDLHSVCVCSLLELYTSLFSTSLVLRSVGLLNNNTVLKGGGGSRVLFRKILKTKKSRESHSWSFCRGNFTFRKCRISEDIASIYCVFFLNIRFRQI